MSIGFWKKYEKKFFGLDFLEFLRFFKSFLQKTIDKITFFGYNRCVTSKTEYAGVAQSVVQLIRNQQVVCSSHITSSKKVACATFLFLRNSAVGGGFVICPAGNVASVTRRSRSCVLSHFPLLQNAQRNRVGRFTFSLFTFHSSLFTIVPAKHRAQRLLVCNA